MTALLQSLTSAIEDRPSRAQIHHMMQQSLADAQQSATAAAVTAGQAAMAPLQQQMQEAWMELESAKGQLTVAQHELSKFREWQVGRTTGVSLHRSCLQLGPEGSAKGCNAQSCCTCY